MESPAEPWRQLLSPNRQEGIEGQLHDALRKGGYGPITMHYPLRPAPTNPCTPTHPCTLYRIALKHAKEAEGFADEELDVAGLLRDIINTQNKQIQDMEAWLERWVGGGGNG